MMLAQQTSPVDPARETVWQLETHWTWAPWFTVLFIVAVVLVIAWLYRLESSPAGRAYRVLLATLRLVSIGLVLLMLSELLLSATRSGLPRLVVLVDRSASMGLMDDKEGATDNQSRLDQARDLLVADDGALLARWRDNYNVELATVADGASRIAGESVTEWVSALEQLDTTGPEALRSRLGDALAAALDERRGLPPAAVVLLSDGRTTAGRSLDEAREMARRRGVPVYAVGFGPTAAPPDLSLDDLLADDLALVGDPVAIRVTARATGMAGESARLLVREADDDRIVAEQPLTMTDDDFREPVQLIVRPDRPGERTYRIEIESAASERNQENNRLTHTIDVRDEKVRVLLAAGYPNYEFRYLKNLLARDSTFELASYLQEADLNHVEQDATAIAQLPLREDDLDEYEVVVLMDLNPRLLPPRWWRNVQSHVVERGGGLVLVAGPRYFPWQYTGVAEVAQLAPIELDAAGRRGGVVDSGLRWQLTPLGQQTAAMLLAGDTAQSESIWRSLPPFYWYAAAQPKPAAQVLAVHPDARSPGGQPLPLAAVQYVGAGRVLYHGVDSTYRWRFRVGDVFFARYWGQTLRYLARSKLTGGDDRAEILVHRGQVEVGEPVRLEVRLGSAGQVTGATAELLLEAEGQPRRRVALAPSRISPRLLQATVSDLPPGRYRVTLGEPRLPAPPAAVEFEVLAPPGELADVTMNEAGLRELATATYGAFSTASEAEELLRDLPAGDRVPLEVLPPVELWNQWWMLLAITGCLTLEWILRKRRAML